MIWFLLALLLGVFLWAVLAYNRLVAQRNSVAEAWAGVDVQLTRRHDLVPNLVETVKGYSRHEVDTLKDVTRLRGQDRPSAAQAGSDESRLSQQLIRLFALAEDYPELKADKNFQQLHQSLVDIENDLQFSRRYYNGSVRDMNNLVESFPSMIIARLFSFLPEEFFEVELASHGVAPLVEL